MKIILLALLLTVSSASAQTQIAPRVAAKGAAARSDVCAPIGKTANGELVYAMKCENMPAPSSPPPQAQVVEPTPPPPETQRSGIFGMSFDRRPQD